MTNSKITIEDNDIAETGPVSPPTDPPVPTAMEENLAAAADDSVPAFRDLLKLLAPVRRIWLTAAFMAAFGSIVGVLPYVAIVRIAAILLDGGTMNDLWGWIALTVGSILVRHLLLLVGTGLCHIAEAKFRAYLRHRIIDRLNKVPLGWFSNTSAGQVRKAVADDVSAIHVIVAHLGSDAPAALVTFLASLTYLFVTEWKMAIVLLVWIFLLIAIIFGIFLKNMGNMWTAYESAQRRLSESAIEITDGVAEVKNFGSTGHLFGRFSSALDNYNRLAHEVMSTTGKPFGAFAALIMPAGMLIPVVFVGMIFAEWGWIQPINILPCLLVGLGMPTSLIAFMGLVQYVRVGLVAAQQTIKLLAEPELPQSDNPIALVGNDIVFENVDFSYNSTDRVLTDISLQLQPGTVTALVGPSGSGKTSLLRLAARFWDVTGGSVKIGGVDVRDASSADLLAHTAIVLQDVAVLGDTVAENIRLARPDASLEEVIQAAKHAHIHDRITALPNGYDTILGEDGAYLSGGERQRLTIARAFIQDAPILLLDEATAYADPHSEREIQKALGQLRRNRTVLVIAHRLHSVIGADQIVVLVDGQIEACATHAELLDSAGTYRKLWEAQTQDRTDYSQTLPKGEVNHD